MPDQSRIIGFSEIRNIDSTDYVLVDSSNKGTNRIQAKRLQGSSSGLYKLELAYDEEYVDPYLADCTYNGIVADLQDGKIPWFLSPQDEIGGYMVCTMVAYGRNPNNQAYTIYFSDSQVMDEFYSDTPTGRLFRR